MNKGKIVAVIGSACLLGASVSCAYAESYEQSDTQSSNAYVAQAPAGYYQPAPTTVYHAPAKAATTDGGASSDTSATPTTYLLGHQREY